MAEMIVQTIRDLRVAIADAPDDQRIDVWYRNTGKVLIAKGVDGENTDFSFVVLDEWPDVRPAGP
jgi:hypothetical protein